MEVSCEEVIKAATDLQGFRNDSPEETKDKTEDTSRKAAKYAAQIKKLAEQTPNAEQKKRLMDAFRDLEDANKAFTVGLISRADVLPTGPGWAVLRPAGMSPPPVHSFTRSISAPRSVRDTTLIARMFGRYGARSARRSR